MKTPEDEAFDDLARNQGAWGGGFPAKRAMAADKLEDDPLAELDGILERLAAGNYTITKYKGTYDVGYMVYARDILAAEKEKNMERDADKLQEPVTEREALKLALEFVESINLGSRSASVEQQRKAIAAIKEALAQAQEPVACVQDLDEVKRKHLVYEKGMDWKDPLYTAPPQRTEQEPDWKTMPPKDAPLVQWVKEQTAPPMPAQQVQFLAGGTRFKLSLDDDGKVNCFGHWKELDGRWVALVAAEDDCHLTLTAPLPVQPAQEPVGVFQEDDDIGYVRLVPHQQAALKDGDKLYTAPPLPVQEPAEWLTGCPTCGMDAGCDCDTGAWSPSPREWVGLTAEEIASIPLNEHTLQTAERLLKGKNA